MKSIRDMVAYYNTSVERDARYEVVEFLLRNLAGLDDISMGDVARQTFVSKSTVSRLARRLGFADYDELLGEARRFASQDPTVMLRMGPETSELVASDPDRFARAYLDEVIASLVQLKESLDMRDLDELIRLMLETPDVALFAADKPLTLARDLQTALLLAGRLAQVGETKQKRQQVARDLPEGSLAVVLSNHGRYVDGNQEMLSDLRRRGVRLWLVTLCYAGPGALLFDHVMRLTTDAYSSVGIYPMRAFVEILVRRMLAARPGGVGARA